MMKRASDRTWELVRSLHSGQSFWRRLVGRPDPPLEAFEELARSGVAQTIPYLADFILSPMAEVREAASRAIGQLFGSVEPVEYVRLDEITRNVLAWESRAVSSWQKLTLNQVGLLRSLPHGHLLIGLASFHNNGYVREAAVQLLSEASDGTEVPFLLVRLNDWVSEVRNAAWRAVRQKIQPNYAKHFLHNLRLVYRLQSCGRGAHSEAVAAIEELLCKPEVMVLLREGIASKDRWLKRQCFRLGVQSKPASGLALLKEALSDDDPITRLWAARNVLSELPEENLWAVLPQLQSDPFMPVRCEALSIIVARLPSRAESELRLALFDPHASVRAAARYYLQRRGVTDFRTIYLNALPTDAPRACRIAIAGLGETGKPEDAETISPFVKSPQISVRKAALRAIASLNGDGSFDELVAALMDEHPGVSNTARIALEMRFALLDVEALWQAFARSQRFHIRKNILLLVFRFPSWTRIRFIIMACADRDPAIVALARQQLDAWQNLSTSNSAVPSHREMDLLLGVLEQHQDILDQRFVRNMKTWMQGFK